MQPIKQPIENKQLRRNVGSLQNKVNRLKRKCNLYRIAIEVRLIQIRNCEKLFDKLKKEGRITIKELKESMLTKREAKQLIK